MDCPVCLDSLNNNNNNKLKTLSCGHVYHYKCYMDIVNRGQNLFVVCPLCRNMNTNIKKPFNNPKDNIKILCNSLKNRCICKTKKGLRCKNKPRLLNIMNWKNLLYHGKKNVRIIIVYFRLML